MEKDHKAISHSKEFGFFSYSLILENFKQGEKHDLFFFSFFLKITWAVDRKWTLEHKKETKRPVMRFL